MPWVFDLQKTHIYNPNWPPHAKFHDGQTLMLSLALALATLYYAWRKKGIAADNFAIALLAAGVYYVTQFLALLVPNTALLDPEFLATTPQPLGLAPQVWVAGVALLISGGRVGSRSRRCRCAASSEIVLRIGPCAVNVLLSGQAAYIKDATEDFGSESFCGSTTRASLKLMFVVVHLAPDQGKQRGRLW